MSGWAVGCWAQHPSLEWLSLSLLPADEAWQGNAICDGPSWKTPSALPVLLLALFWVGPIELHGYEPSAGSAHASYEDPMKTMAVARAAERREAST